MKNRFYISLIIGLCIGIMLFFIWRVYPRVPDNIYAFVDMGTHRAPSQSVEINRLHQYGQSFQPNFNHLFGISIFIPKQDLNKDKTLVFHLKEDPSATQDLVTFRWKYHELHPSLNSFYTIPPDLESRPEGFHFHFQFPAVKKIKHRPLYMIFESPDAQPSEGIKLGVWKSWIKNARYEALKEGCLFENGKPIQGALAFRTYHTFGKGAAALLREIKSRLLQDKAFLIVYAAILWILVLSFLLTMKSVALAKHSMN